MTREFIRKKNVDGVKGRKKTECDVEHLTNYYNSNEFLASFNRRVMLSITSRINQMKSQLAYKAYFLFMFIVFRSSDSRIVFISAKYAKQGALE